MTLLIDTNVILDVFQKREPFFFHSYTALRKAAEQNADCYLSSSAVTDIFYILRKSFQSKERAKETLQNLVQLIAFTDVLPSDIMDALASEMPDFEDALVNAVAHRIGADYILTRNTRDYAKSDVPAITPEEYLKQS